MSLSPEAIATLKKITTATITTILLKKGLRNIWLRGVASVASGAGAAGRSGIHVALRARAGRSRDA